MSTSSGREGFCTRCGHANNEHARERESKCKKCKKVFEICQAGVHGDESSGGWRLCFVPCGCGKRHYPDKANRAVPLEPHEYVLGHPAYRPLYPDEDETIATIDDSQTDTGGAMDSVSTPQKGGSWSIAQSGHTRTDSGESEDPLAWSPEKYQQRTGSIAGLVEDMSNTHIEDPGSAKGKESQSSVGEWSDWYWSSEHKCEIRHRQNAAVTGGWEYGYGSAGTSKGKQSQSSVGEWSEWYWSTEYKCEVRHRQNAAVTGGWEYEYRSSAETPAASATSSKSSKTGPKSGKGKGKAKK